MKKAISSLSPGLFSSRPSPVIIPYGPHAWGNRVLGWMGRSMGDQTVRNVTLDMRKKKMASESSSTMKKPNAEKRTLTADSNEHTNGNTSSTATAIDETSDAHTKQ